jgi:hypothetical protein
MIGTQIKRPMSIIPATTERGSVSRLDREEERADPAQATAAASPPRTAIIRRTP